MVIYEFVSWLICYPDLFLNYEQLIIKNYITGIQGKTTVENVLDSIH
jgi:hypothetical protein